MGSRPLSAIAIAFTTLILACSGPRATATEGRVRPSARPGFYRVETQVVNSGGSGQVDLTVRLRNRATGRIVTQEQPVDLQPRDRADVVVEIPAPPGDYTAEVSVDYPPR
jgi:hypothetical protein